MHRKTSDKIILRLVILLIVIGGILFHDNKTCLAFAEEKKVNIEKRMNKLRESAQVFAKAYAKRDFKTMYDMVIPQYRRRVPLWEYKDFVDYPGVTDGYIEVSIEDVSLLPKSKYRYGKVMQKILMIENVRTKGTGEVTKLEDEKWEFQDWVLLRGKWYKIEKIDSN